VPYYQAAGGEEFLAFTVHTDSLGEFDQGYLSSNFDLSPTFTVRSSVSQTSLNDLLSDTNDAEVTVVVSVPAGEDAQLVVGVANLDQAMSIRTGQRTSTTAEAYYRSRASFDVQRQYSGKVARGDFQLTHSATFTQAALSPFHPTEGWAPSGQMYLTLACQDVRLEKSYEYATPSFNTNDSVTAVGAAEDGTVLLGGFPSDPSNLTALTFRLPVDAKSLRVRYAPKGTFALESYHDPDYYSPDRGTFALKPSTFTVDFER